MYYDRGKQNGISPNGGGTDLKRRTFLRHLFTFIKRTYYFFKRSGGRQYGKPDCGTTSVLEAEDPEKDIYLYINSPGGVVTAGLAIYDTMNFIKPDVATLCTGQAASMGAFLLSAGAKGKRFALPHARIMIHQPLGGARGQATDIQIQAEEILRLKATLTRRMAEHSGQSYEKC